jgi:hypothetical protein
MVSRGERLGGESAFASELLDALALTRTPVHNGTVIGARARR